MMQKSACKLRAVLGFLAVLAAGPLHAVIHLDASNCALCHVAGAIVTAENAALLTASQEVLCKNCHPTAVQLSHPSGFKPAAVPPATYPLDWKGDLTCSSCHTIHGSSIGLIRGTVVGRDLCLACHTAGFFTAMLDGGASLMVGHLSSGIAIGGPDLDGYSLQCMECHGASADPSIATSVDINGVVRHASQLANHPIGMNYQTVSASGGYRARSMVEQKLLLPDGKVSCVSCHYGYQKQHGKLRIDQSKSALCLECHEI